MSRSSTPKYRVNIDGLVMAWKGRATDGRLRAYVFDYAKSLEAGGCNEHVSMSIGHVPYPYEARIIRQADGEVVASWSAGMFQVWP